MAYKEIDVKGMPCPKPLIATKRALSDESYPQGFVVLIDNETSKDNVERYLSDNDVTFSTLQNGEVFSVTVEKSRSQQSATSTEGYCVAGPLKKHVICFSGATMGKGADELGTILIQACVNTVKEAEPLPESLIFYNSGVMLTVDDSPVIESLKELEQMGVELVICGTCADYFKLKERISIGTISNMYTILDKLTAASKVIYP